MQGDNVIMTLNSNGYNVERY